MEKEIKETSTMSFREHGKLLLKRCIALPSKMIGFKPLCLYLATWLLHEGLISEWGWLCVLCMVLFGIVGLKVLTKYQSAKQDHTTDITMQGG